MEPAKLKSIEYDKRFETEEACIDHLKKLRWPSGFICPRCGHDDGYQLREPRLIQCVVCRKQTSVLVDSIFERTHMPLTIWFKVIYSMAEDKVHIRMIFGRVGASIWPPRRMVFGRVGAFNFGRCGALDWPPSSAFLATLKA